MNDKNNIKQKSAQYLDRLNAICGELDTLLSDFDNLSDDEIKAKLKQCIGDIAYWSFGYENMMKYCVEYIEKSHNDGPQND